MSKISSLIIKANSLLLGQRDVCSLGVYTCLLLCFQGTFHWSEFPSDCPQEVKGPCADCFPVAIPESIWCWVSVGETAPQGHQEVNVIMSYEN